MNDEDTVFMQYCVKVFDTLFFIKISLLDVSFMIYCTFLYVLCFVSRK